MKIENFKKSQKIKKKNKNQLTLEYLPTYFFRRETYQKRQIVRMLLVIQVGLHLWMEHFVEAHEPAGEAGGRLGAY